MLIGIPAELFVRLGLAIKQAAYPSRTHIIGLANGMVGYLPTREAFDRGGFEATLSSVSKLAPGAGEQIVTAAQDLYTTHRPKSRAAHGSPAGRR